MSGKVFDRQRHSPFNEHHAVGRKNLERETPRDANAAIMPEQCGYALRHPSQSLSRWCDGAVQWPSGSKPQAEECERSFNPFATVIACSSFSLTGTGNRPVSECEADAMSETPA